MVWEWVGDDKAPFISPVIYINIAHFEYDSSNMAYKNL